MNWVILLARGRVAVRVLPVEWQLNGEGMADVASSLTGWLRDLLGPDAPLPRVVFTDRGTGMYSPAGHVLPRYDRALRAAGLRPFFGADATAQAPDMGDLLLHETACFMGSQPPAPYKAAASAMGGDHCTVGQQDVRGSCVRQHPPQGR